MREEKKPAGAGLSPLTNSPSGQELLDDCSYGDAEEGDADCGMGADISRVPSAADAGHYRHPAENLADGVLSYCRTLLCLIKSDSVTLLAFGHSNDPFRATRNDEIKAFQGGGRRQGPRPASRNQLALLAVIGRSFRVWWTLRWFSFHSAQLPWLNPCRRALHPHACAKGHPHSAADTREAQKGIKVKTCQPESQQAVLLCVACCCSYLENHLNMPTHQGGGYPCINVHQGGGYLLISWSAGAQSHTTAAISRPSEMPQLR